MVTRNLAIALSLALAPFPAATAAAQERPEKIRLTPQSKDGVVMVRVSDSQVPYLLMFQRVGNTGFGSRVYMLKVEPGRGPQWLARTLKPGRYKLTSIIQQQRWSLALDAQPTAFDVAAARVSFLGTLNADALLRSLQEKVLAEGKTVLTGLAAGYGTTDTATAPFVGRDEAGLAEARSFGTSVMGAPAVELAELGSTAALKP